MGIQKLDMMKDTRNVIDKDGIVHTVANFTAIDKINELVDAVNTIQKEREAEWFEIQEWISILEAVRKSVNVHEKQIDELQMKVEPEKCETPAENVQKEPITLLDIFNEMGEMYSSLWNKMEDIHHDLKTKSGDNE